MKQVLFWLCLLSVNLAAEPVVVKLWPADAPGESAYLAPANAQEIVPSTDDVIRIGLVTAPEMHVYKASEPKGVGSTVLICPGGGYGRLAWNKEGTEVAEWLNRLGVSAAVLKYRVPRRDPERPHAAPMQDAQRGLRMLRARAAEWGVSVNRVGVLGFSAGGHLAVMTALHVDELSYPKQDEIDAFSARADFLVPIYPAYLGNEKVVEPLDPLVRVTPSAPPTFLAVTHDDALRGVNAAQFYIALKQANIPAELHIYQAGGHGYGLRPSEKAVSSWPARCEEWFKQIGVLPR